MDHDNFEDGVHYARIDVSDYFDLRGWAKRFGVTAGDVRRAVAAVGDRAWDVEAHLARLRSEAAAPVPGDAHLPG